MAACVAPKPVYTVNRALTDFTVTHDAMGTNTPTYHLRCWLLKLVLVIIWMNLFLFSVAVTASMISKNNLRCGVVRPQHTFPLCVSLSQMRSDSEKSAAFLDVVNIWPLFTWERPNFHSSILHQSMFTDIGFPNCSQPHVVSFI